MSKQNKIIFAIVLSLCIIFLFIFCFYRNRVPIAPDLGKCDSGKFQSNAEILSCLRDLKTDLLKERESVYQDYLSLEHPRVDINFQIPLEIVKTKIKNWYDSTDEYRKKYCEAKLTTYSDGSGYFEGIEICEIKVIQKDVQFLRERISELEDYSQNFTP